MRTKLLFTSAILLLIAVSIIGAVHLTVDNSRTYSVTAKLGGMTIKAVVEIYKNGELVYRSEDPPCEGFAVLITDLLDDDVSATFEEPRDYDVLFIITDPNAPFWSFTLKYSDISTLSKIQVKLTSNNVKVLIINTTTTVIDIRYAYTNIQSPMKIYAIALGQTATYLFFYTYVGGVDVDVGDYIAINWRIYVNTPALKAMAEAITETITGVDISPLGISWAARPSFSADAVLGLDCANTLTSTTSSICSTNIITLSGADTSSTYLYNATTHEIVIRVSLSYTNPVDGSTITVYEIAIRSYLGSSNILSIYEPLSTPITLDPGDTLSVVFEIRIRV